jgi:hypothetical protein
MERVGGSVPCLSEVIHVCSFGCGSGEQHFHLFFWLESMLAPGGEDPEPTSLN